MNNTTINIVSATQAGDYSLTIEFDDKTVQTVDFGPFLKRSRHPDVRAYLQPERFASFHVTYGELVWGDFAGDDSLNEFGEHVLEALLGVSVSVQYFRAVSTCWRPC